MHKQWYSVYGTSPNGGDEILLAKVRSQGCAHIVAQALRRIYTNVRIV